MRQPKILSCYARGVGSSWEGICLDLDIAVQGDSFQDVSRRLRDAITSYLDYIETLPERDRERLMYRRAPLWTRSRWILGAISTMVFRRTNNERTYHNYSIPCAV